MVRGPAALLAAVALFAVAGDLPDVGALVAGCVGALAVGLCALVPLAGRDDPVATGVFGLGAALLTAALAAAEVGALANPAEALVGASAGLLFAWAFAAPAAVLALPLLVAAIDAVAVLSGRAQPVAAGQEVDALTFVLPRWGSGDAAAHLPVLDATFLAMFAAWALRFDLRPRRAVVLMLGGLVLATAIGVAVDRAVPALPLVALGFLAAHPRRLVGLVRSGDEA